MLHAIIARKARMSKILDGAGKQPREDLVTSSLFGTLCFLSGPARRRALAALIGAQLADEVDIILWPKFKLEGSIVEPDVVIRTTLNGKPNFWIVEVKWGARLHDDQIDREIAALRKGDCFRGELQKDRRVLQGYTLLGMELHHESAIKCARVAYTDLDIHGVAWHEATERLDELLSSPEIDVGLAAWAKITTDFLRGTPQGSILGTWPDLVPPSASAFMFTSGTDFSLRNAVRPIKSALYSFT